ncbi:hypothetical protein [Candidatus Phytoplasma sp. AldY-WA1]|uniref:hypothetical protein n=1 Tax=Candidatus Phytoplasma sp. AldY-WA1 TaxID=2852100 RepID=UPI00254E076D|nr:hypothetical protein [Candidatus Phytoplasma sp. AldY-WA1]
MKKEIDEEDDVDNKIQDKRESRLDGYIKIVNELETKLNKNETPEDMIITQETLNIAHENKLDEIDARKDAIKSKQFYKVQDIRKQKRCARMSKKLETIKH